MLSAGWDRSLGFRLFLKATKRRRKHASHVNPLLFNLNVRFLSLGDWKRWRTPSPTLKIRIRKPNPLTGYRSPVTAPPQLGLVLNRALSPVLRLLLSAAPEGRRHRMRSLDSVADAPLPGMTVLSPVIPSGGPQGRSRGIPRRQSDVEAGMWGLSPPCHSDRSGPSGPRSGGTPSGESDPQGVRTQSRNPFNSNPDPAPASLTALPHPSTAVVSPARREAPSRGADTVRVPGGAWGRRFLCSPLCSSVLSVSLW